MNLAPLQQLITSLESFDAKVVMSGIVDDNAEVLAQLQRDQLIEGKDITGQVRNDQYAPLTVSIKKQYGVGAGAITDLVDADFFLRKSKIDKNYRLLKRIKSRECEEQDGAKLIRMNPETLWFELIEESSFQQPTVKTETKIAGKKTFFITFLF